MARSLVIALALAAAAQVTLLPATAEIADRTLPMRFELRLDGPADACGSGCKLWIWASSPLLTTIFSIARRWISSLGYS